MKPGDGFVDQIVGPTSVPISVDEAKAQVEVDDTEHDGLVIAAVLAAQAHVQNKLARAIGVQTLEWVLPGFSPWLGLYRFDGRRYYPLDDCPAFTIPRPPLISVTSIKYIDEDGAEQTISPSSYRVTAPRGPLCDYGMIDMVDDFTWPTAMRRRDAVRIRFEAGYTAAECPEPIRQVIKKLTGSFFETREAEFVGVSVSDDTMIERLLSDYIARG